MNQVHKNVLLSRTKVVNNILKIWQLSQSKDRYDWYAEAYDYACELVKIKNCLPTSSEININQACGVISALSPVKRWESNKKIALELITTGDCGHMAQFKNKAKAIISSDGLESSVLKILNGRKIQAFYLNIRYPDKAINLTIDRHALSVALGYWAEDSEYAGLTPKQYAFFSSCYRHAAAKMKVNALIMQSATWLVWRKIKTTYPNVQLSIKW